jgi:hypothetical protein
MSSLEDALYEALKPGSRSTYASAKLPTDRDLDKFEEMYTSTLLQELKERGRS